MPIEQPVKEEQPKEEIQNNKQEEIKMKINQK